MTPTYPPMCDGRRERMERVAQIHTQNGNLTLEQIARMVGVTARTVSEDLTRFYAQKQQQT